ncbi:MAG TPA: hypothetical protein VJ873_07265, partial [bacterium]|nr:hypothetical protein [bacterium]
MIAVSLRKTRFMGLALLGAFSLLLAAACATAAPNPFSVVPSNDPTYGQLQQLEASGLLPEGASQGPLTRFEVAQRIFKADKKFKEIVVAQADTDIPPPPPDNGETSTSTAAPPATTAPAP